MNRTTLILVLILTFPLLLSAQKDKDIDHTDEQGYTKLMAAVMRMELETVNSLIASGADVNIKKTYSNYTALHYAADAYGYTNDFRKSSVRFDEGIQKAIKMVRALIKAGADVNALENNGVSPLLLGADVPSHEITKMLLDANAYVNPIDTSQGNNPLLVAALAGQEQNARLILDKGGDFTKINNNKRTVLFESLRNMFSLDFIKALHKKGADLNIKNRDGETALFYAVTPNKGNPEIVKYLIDNGVDLNAMDSYGNNVFANTFSGSVINIPLIDILLGAKINVNLKNQDGNSILGILAKQRVEDTLAFCRLIKKILDAGADINSVDQEGNTPLLSFVKGNYELSPPIQMLIDAGSDVNKLDNAGLPALEYAISQFPLNANPEVVMALLKKTNSVNTKKTIYPLIWACNTGQVEIARLLIQKGTNVNMIIGDQYSDFSTPLLYAASTGQTEIVKLLIQAKANVNQASRAHKITPLMVAAREGHADVVKLLLAAKANVAAKYLSGYTAAEFAIIKNQEETAKILIPYFKTNPVALGNLLVEAAMCDKPAIVKMLIDAKANVNVKRSDGYSPLQLAVNELKVENVKLLIAAKADVNYKTPDGYTPLSAAKESGIQEIIDMLVKAGAK